MTNQTPEILGQWLGPGEKAQYPKGIETQNDQVEDVSGQIHKAQNQFQKGGEGDGTSPLEPQNGIVVFYPALEAIDGSGIEPIQRSKRQH